MSSSEANKWAMFCHLSALVGLLGNIVGFLVGPLIVWLVKRDSDTFVDEQGKEAVNFQITMMIAFIISGALVFLLVGIPLLIILGLLELIMPIIAGLKASNGESYRYPFTIRFIK